METKAYKNDVYLSPMRLDDEDEIYDFLAACNMEPPHAEAADEAHVPAQSSGETYPIMTSDWDNTPSISKYTAEASAKYPKMMAVTCWYDMSAQDEKVTLLSACEKSRGFGD